jgi:hypothetical protein
MNQREIQIWNDAVAACKAAAMAEVDAMELAAANGMPNPARAVVRAVGGQYKPKDDRNRISPEMAAKIEAALKNSHP